MVVAWLLFPLVPVVLEDLHCSVSIFKFDTAARAGPDPFVWGWLNWVLVLGPLVGYGFLAGATVRLPDVPAVPRRHLRNLLVRRAVWVGIGPWWGAVVCVGVFYALAQFQGFFPTLQRWHPRPPKAWEGTAAGMVLSWTLLAFTWLFWIALAGLWAYGWLWPAASALARSARVGQWKATLIRGIVVAVAFVGSLFGGFWAATAVWRSYFFDARFIPLALLAVGLAVTSGCAARITYGDMRRRELFHAMLVAWVLGLALMWRWWSRSRRQHP